MANKEQTVDDILNLIKNPIKKENKDKCILLRKIDTLPEHMREAVIIAVDDSNVSNRDIMAFLTNHTDIKIAFRNIQDHRAKAGCLGCLYGGSNS